MKSILTYTAITIVVFFLLSRTHKIHPPTEWDEEEFNVTNMIVSLFPEIDVDPADHFVSVHELSKWNLHHVQRQILHHSQQEMVVYDTNSDGFVSFSEFGLSTSTSGSLSSFLF